MSIAGIISGALKLASVVAQFFNRRQLMRAGAAKQKAASQGKVLENVEIARGVTVLVEHGDGDFGRRLRDRFRRTDSG